MLENFYGAHVCSPSRAQLLTGLYSSRVGMRHIVRPQDHCYGIHPNFTLLPQHLSKLGYSTHLVGK